MGAGLGDPALSEDDDAVRAAHAGEAVGDDHAGHAAGHVQEPVEEGRLGPYVELGRGFVENEQGCAVGERQHGAGECDPLPLPAGEVGAALVLSAEHGGQAVRQAVQGVQDARSFGGGAQRGGVGQQLLAAQRDVLGGGQLQPGEVLEDDGDPPVPGGGIDGRELGAADRDPAAGRRVQPGQQLHQGGLAGSVEADDRGGGALGQLQFQSAKHFGGLGAVAEADLLEADRPGQGRGGGDGGRARRGHPVLQMPQRVLRGEPVQRLHVALREEDSEAHGDQYGLQRGAELEQRERPGGAAAGKQHQCRGAADQSERGERDERAEQQLPPGRPERPQIGPGLLTVALAQPRHQPQHPGLLGDPATAGGAPQVGQPPPLAGHGGPDGAEPAERVALPVPDDQRGDGDQGGRNQPQYHGHHDSGTEELGVAGDECQRPGGGVAGGGGGPVEAAAGLREQVQHVPFVEVGGWQAVQRTGHQVADPGAVHLPGDQLGGEGLEGGKELLEQEGTACQQDSEPHLGGGPPGGVRCRRIRQPGDDVAGGEDETDRQQAYGKVQGGDGRQRARRHLPEQSHGGEPALRPPPWRATRPGGAGEGTGWGRACGHGGAPPNRRGGWWSGMVDTADAGPPERNAIAGGASWRRGRGRRRSRVVRQASRSRREGAWPGRKVPGGADRTGQRCRRAPRVQESGPDQSGASSHLLRASGRLPQIEQRVTSDTPAVPGIGLDICW